jgi:hypothetical protein
VDLPKATDLGEAMLGDPQAHCREVKDLPARLPGADVLARELTLANPSLLRQRRTRSLLAIAVTAGRTVRVPAGLPQSRAKLGVLTLQQFLALSQFLNLSGLGEQQLSQGLHLRRDLRSHGSKLTQFQIEGWVVTKFLCIFDFSSIEITSCISNFIFILSYLELSHQKIGYLQDFS